MKKSYVPVTLNEFLNESKSITLKRGYGERKPVVVGANAPLRNQVLAYMNESQKVSKTDLKKFIAGLNETSKNPSAAANMWIKRNSKFFVTESKNGVTYYKLSTIGKRLANNLVPKANLSESEDSNKFNLRQRLEEMHPTKKINEDYDQDQEEENMKPGSYDFVDRKRGYERPGINDDSTNEVCDESADEDEKLDEATKARIKKIIENIKAKRNTKLNEEEEEEKPTEDDDELTFDDLNLEDDEEKAEGDEEKVEDDEEKAEGDEDKVEDDEEKIEDTEGEEAESKAPEGEEEKVEITEFVITVDNVDESISELGELGVTAEQVVDEEGEPIEDQIKVSSDDWEALKGWLEDKGVDIEEMFGGEIEVEEPTDLGDEVDVVDDVEDDLKDDSDLEGEEFDLELDGPEGEEGEISLDLEGPEGENDELDLDLEKEDDVEESLTGMEREERQQTPNLVQGKEVTITIK